MTDKEIDFLVLLINNKGKCYDGRCSRCPFSNLRCFPNEVYELALEELKTVPKDKLFDRLL